MSDPQDLSHHAERLAEIWADLCEKQYSLNENGIASIWRFLMYLPPEDIYEAMIVASEKIVELDRIEERFKYFCGICWNTIKGKGVSNTKKLEDEKCL